MKLPLRARIIASHFSVLPVSLAFLVCISDCAMTFETSNHDSDQASQTEGFPSLRI